MSESSFFAAFFFPSAAAVVIFSMKYVAAIVQARSRLAQEDAYRDLAARSAATQAETASALTEIQARLVNVEKILREVE